MGRVLSMKAAPSEEFMGHSGNDVDLVDFTLVADTNIYADNDVLSISALTGTLLARVPGGAFEIVSATLFDAADQGTEVWLYFTTNGTTPGTINSAVSAADAVLDDIQGYIDFITYEDLINSQVCSRKALGLVLKCAPGQRDMYVFSVVRSGTPTYAAASLRVQLGIRRF